MVVISIALCGTVMYLYPQMAENRLRQIEIEQREETERNEEDNQFWQKLVPWGSYEDEEGKATDG